MKHSITFIWVLLPIGISVSAQAACDRYPSVQHGVSFPDTITVPENLPVGRLITSQVFNGPYPTFYMNCPTNTPTVLTGRFTTSTSASGGLIYHTNVPGIGMRVIATLTSGPNLSMKLKSENLTSAAGRLHWGATRLVAEFYKMGPVTTGTLPGGDLHYNNWNGGRGFHRVMLNNAIRFVNPTATCDLAAGDLNRTITLPTIKVSALRDAVYAGTHNFDLTANCTNATNVTFRFTGTPAPGNTALFANTGSASGVGLWLSSRGPTATIAPTAPNNTRTVTVSGNRAILPLSAAYHRNGTVSQGTLVSTATVNITYN